MSAAVAYVRTADGDLAARVAHLVIALVPAADGTMRTLTAWPARDPESCTRRDFNPGGFAANDENGFRTEVEEFAEHHRQLEALGRRDIPTEALRRINTPWETPDSGQVYGRGIASVNTPGHGGFILLAEQNDLIDERWRAKGDGYGGMIEDVLDPDWRERSDGFSGVAFYEEDAEWAIVAVSFPHLFTARELRFANRTLMRDYPDTWEAVTGGTVPEGFSPTRNKALFRAANAGRWIVGSASRSRNDASKVVVSASVDGRDERGHTKGAVRLFLLDSDDYGERLRTSGVYECVIDEDADQEVNRHEEPIDRRKAA